MELPQRANAGQPPREALKLYLMAKLAKKKVWLVGLNVTVCLITFQALPSFYKHFVWLFTRYREGFSSVWSARLPVFLTGNPVPKLWRTTKTFLHISCWPWPYFTKSSHIQQFSVRHELKKKKKKEPTRFYFLMTMFTVICLPPSTSIFNLLCGMHQLWPFRGAFSVLLQSAAGSVRPTCWFIQPSETVTSKGRESAATRALHSTAKNSKKKKKSDFPPRLISTENQKNVPYLYRFVSFFLLEPSGNFDLIWAARRHSSSKQ